MGWPTLLPSIGGRAERSRNTRWRLASRLRGLVALISSAAWLLPVTPVRAAEYLWGPETISRQGNSSLNQDFLFRLTDVLVPCVLEVRSAGRGPSLAFLSVNGDPVLTPADHRSLPLRRSYQFARENHLTARVI